jgi:hypothetical protein
MVHNSKIIINVPSQPRLVQLVSIPLPFIRVMNMIQNSEAIDGPSRQDGIPMNTSTLISIPSPRIFQLPKLRYKSAIKTLRGTNLQEMVSIMTGSSTTDINLLNTQDIGIQFCQGAQDLLGFVIPLNVPLETTNTLISSTGRRWAVAVL